MRRFADLVEALANPHAREAALASYLLSVPKADGDAARALLDGRRPKRAVRPDELRHWVLETAGLPDWLFEVSLAASGDATEVLALLLPPASGPVPGLEDVLSLLAPLAGQGADHRRAAVMALAARLDPQARALMFRLATGQFRRKLPAPAAAASGAPGTIRALLIMAETAPAPGQPAPELSFGLRAGNGVVPLVRFCPVLPPDQARDLAQWVRAHTLEKFGPKRSLPPDLVFALSFAGLSPNARKKCGFDLIQPRLDQWLRDASPDQTDDLARLAALAQAGGESLDDD